jgi:predicted DNA-binding transcriptional regulator AlpA
MPHYLDVAGMCRKIGGSRPLHRSTIYRKVQAGILPKPIKLGRVARWVEPEVDAVLQQLADKRNSPGHE